MLPKSLTQPLRQGQLTVGAGWRAYFAPFNQALAVNQNSTVLGPTIYDLSNLGKWKDTAPASGWYDLGFLRNFRFTPQSKTGNVIAGYRGVIRAKYRAEVGEKMTCTFAEYSRTALRIATGTQIFNLLKGTTVSTDGPLSGAATAATPMVSYSASGYGGATSGLPTVVVTTGQGANYAVGSYIVCDKDYNGTDFGFVGDQGANVFEGCVTDTDFIRRTSDYVACVKELVPDTNGGDGLVLTGPFVGGGNAAVGTPNVFPVSGAQVQGIVGYASREGGTYIAEWSGLFILDTIDASQVLLYYPRIAPDTFGGLPGTNLQNATSMQTYELEASFDALAFDDPLDGETVVRYSAYYPHPNSNIQI